MPKIWIFRLILVALVLGAMEGLSFLSLHLLERARPGTVLDLFLRDYFAALTEQEIEDFRARAFDPDLGWTNRPGTAIQTTNAAGQAYAIHYGADGEREDGLTEPKPLVAVYGGSFTLGDEVDDDQSWPFFLQRWLGRDVRNFATNAYGTDQSLLKFEQHVRSGPIAPVVVLGIMSENINRISNSFRPFYLPTTIYKLGFKPRYACDDRDRLTLETNPMQTFRAEPAALQRLAAEAAGRDPYAQGKLKMSWPFTVEMLELTYQYGRRKLGLSSRLFSGHPSFDLWTDPDSTHLLRCIVRRFADLAMAEGSSPVLVFLPTAGQGHAPPYTGFIAELQAFLPALTIVDVSKEAFDPHRYGITPQGGHPSPYGNRIIAAAVHRAIEGLEKARPPLRP